MITPEYLNEIMYAMQDKLIYIDNYLLSKIVKRILKAYSIGKELFIPATMSDMRKLIDAGVLYEDIELALQKALPTMQGLIKDCFYEAAYEITMQNADIAAQICKIEGFPVVVPDYSKVGITNKAEKLGLTPVEIRHLETAYRRTCGTVKNFTRTTARVTQQIYINACDTAYMKCTQGVSVQAAVVEAIKELSDKGIQCISFGGKQENMEVAVARAVRTGINQANAEIVLTRCAEMGVSYVKTSAHLGARVTPADDYTNHSWWQGRVYSVDWKNPITSEFASQINVTSEEFQWLNDMRNYMQTVPKKNYPDFIETCGYGDIQGICGINCRHSFYPYYPDVQTDDDSRPDLDENRKRYELDQKQRAMERAIRKTKKRLNALSTIDRTEEEFLTEKKKTKDLLKQQSDKYMDFCKKNGLKPRNMSLKV